MTAGNCEWGMVPFTLAHHCQNCDLVTAAPNGRCAQCGSESVAPLRRDVADPAPVHPVRVRIEIDGEDFDYVRYVLGMLSLEAEERNAGSFQMLSGGGGGSYALTTATREISREAYRAELEAWRRRWRDRNPAGRRSLVRTAGGEPVVLASGAVMGAEMIAPEQRDARGDAVL